MAGSWELIEKVQCYNNDPKAYVAKCTLCGEVSRISHSQFHRNVGRGCGKCYTMHRSYPKKQVQCVWCGISFAVNTNYRASKPCCRATECNQKKMASITKNRRERDVRSLLTALVVSVKSRSKRKGYQFDLDEEWVDATLAAQRGKCALSGATLLASAAIGKQRAHKHTASIDRIDSTKGYTKDNCWIVTCIINSAKNAHKVEDVIEMCKNVLTHNGYSVVKEGTSP